jgi:hypothetical protein
MELKGLRGVTSKLTREECGYNCPDPSCRVPALFKWIAFGYAVSRHVSNSDNLAVHFPTSGALFPRKPSFLSTGTHGKCYDPPISALIVF